MMKKDIILGTLMVIIALLLATNLFLGHGLKLFCAEASAESAQKIALVARTVVMFMLPEAVRFYAPQSLGKQARGRSWLRNNINPPKR